jgi:hypothetical protein
VSSAAVEIAEYSPITTQVQGVDEDRLKMGISWSSPLHPKS